MIVNLQHIFPPYNFSRIISLVPSLSELLSDLDLKDEVIGITKFCIHPTTWYKTKPRVGGTKKVNMTMIHSLQPDLIIANKEENVQEQVEELARYYNVVVTDVKDLETALSMINDIGKLTNKIEKAAQIVAGVKAKFRKLQRHFEMRGMIKSAYLIWRNPYMAAGGDTFINDMMLKCGFQNIYSSVPRYPLTTLSDIKKRGCELLLLSSEPYPFTEKHLQEIKADLHDVKIMLADGEMFSWYGSRLLKAADYFESFNSKR